MAWHEPGIPFGKDSFGLVCLLWNGFITAQASRVPAGRYAPADLWAPVQPVRHQSTDQASADCCVDLGAQWGHEDFGLGHLTNWNGSIFCGEDGHSVCVCFCLRLCPPIIYQVLWMQLRWSGTGLVAKPSRLSHL